MIVVESWQSGNAPDSKSGEPSFPWRAGSNPVLSLKYRLKPLDITAFISVRLAKCSPKYKKTYLNK